MSSSVTDVMTRFGSGGYVSGADVTRSLARPSNRSSFTYAPPDNSNLLQLEMLLLSLCQFTSLAIQRLMR